MHEPQVPVKRHIKEFNLENILVWYLTNGRYDMCHEKVIQVHFQKFNFSYTVELDASENQVISHGSRLDQAQKSRENCIFAYSEHATTQLH